MDFNKLSEKYHGSTAESYEDLRSNKKWRHEQRTIASLIEDLPSGSSVLDIPVGTGRFIPLYIENNIQATGMDISEDMLEQARGKINEQNTGIVLKKSDIRKIGVSDDSFDCVLCMRFLNWIDSLSLHEVVSELARVSGGTLILGIRHFVTLGEIRPHSGYSNLKRMLRQFKRRLSSNSGLVFHEKKLIADMFEKLGLVILSAECVERRGDGTDYYIYHLGKRR